MTEVAPGRKTDEQNHQRITLLATSISYVLVILDTSIVNVALENISRDLLADAHRIADGTRIAATISTASTALIILIIWHLRRQREHTLVNAGETRRS